VAQGANYVELIGSVGLVTWRRKESAVRYEQFGDVAIDSEAIVAFNLAGNHYIPPNAHGWVDHLRQKGNEATHELPAVSPDDAKELMTLTEILLRIVYEFPAKFPPSGP
jgi:hypothetical protein